MRRLLKARTLGYLFLLGLFAGISGVAVFHLVEETGTPEYCASCHQMEFFYDTWNGGPHGANDEGAVEAVCVDCHLPHDGTIRYLAVKARSGMHDMWAAVTGVDTDWPAGLERRNEYTYVSGCSRCHVELVAPGIPIKAINAHRDYRLGATEKTCIDCHTGAGHGDLPAAFMDAEEYKAAGAPGEAH